jgi:hypothetical protein
MRERSTAGVHTRDLKATNASKNSGTDLTDLGVNFVTLKAAMNPLLTPLIP